MTEFHDQIDIACFLQEDDTKCGAACAQTVLHAVGAPLVSQDDLLLATREERSPREVGKGWQTTPRGLANALNHFSGRSDMEFRALCFRYRKTAELLIRRAISESRIPPIVLCNKGTHWVLVSGIWTSAEPRGPDDESYKIRKFAVWDPMQSWSARVDSPNSATTAQGIEAAEPHCVRLRDWRASFDAFFDHFVVVCNLDSDRARACGD